MRTTKIALAAVLAATALAANAGPRMESASSPFTYEVLGATPSLNVGRAAAPAASQAAPKAVTAPKAAAAATRTGGAAVSPFTYEALGATPHVELKKPATTEVLTQQPTR